MIPEAASLTTEVDDCDEADEPVITGHFDFQRAAREAAIRAASTNSLMVCTETCSGFDSDDSDLPPLVDDSTTESEDLCAEFHDDSDSHDGEDCDMDTLISDYKSQPAKQKIILQDLLNMRKDLRVILVGEETHFHEEKFQSTLGLSATHPSKA